MIKAEGPTPPPMRLEDRQWAGLFLFAGTVQFAIGMIIAEAVDPTYSVATNYISDLGVRAGAPIFNASIILLGIAILATSWFVFRAFKDRILMIVVLLAGAGAVGDGGMERMIVYPVLAWGIGFGGYLLGMAHGNERPAAA